MARTRASISARRSASGRSSTPVRSTRALPAPDTPSLVLMITWLDRRPGGEHVADRVGDLGEAVQVLDARADAGRRTRRTAGGNRSCVPEVGQPRIRPVHRDAEAQREVALERGRVVGDQVAARAVRDLRRDPGEQSGSLQQLLAERPVGGVVGGEQRQPGQRVARDDPGQQSEVVLDDPRVDRHRGHVDHPQPRLPQQQEQEEEPLLERLGDGRAACRRPGARVTDGTTTTDSSSRFSFTMSQTDSIRCCSASNRSSTLDVVELGQHRRRAIALQSVD